MSKKAIELLERVNTVDCRSGVLQIIADDINPACDFCLKESMQTMSKKICEKFWLSIMGTIEKINNSVFDYDDDADNRSPNSLSSRNLEFLEAINSIFTTVMDNDIVWCPSMDRVLDFVDHSFFALTEDIQESYCQLFEKIWIKEIDFRENYVPSMCTYLMTKAMRLGKGFNAYMNRLNTVRECFKLIDFNDTHSDTLKALILRSIAVPQFISHNHGKRLLSMFIILTPSFPRESFVVLKEIILSMPIVSVRKWGDVMMASDLSCDDIPTRQALEDNVIQEIMNICIHTANQKVFLTTKALLGSFVHYRKHKELWARITRLYEPILFRSLKAVNATVRRNAAIAFTDCFPLGTSDSRETLSVEDQFKDLLNLCDDDCSDVRGVAIAGVLHLISNYYELLPISVTNMIFDHFIKYIMFDSQVEVREHCIRGFTELLDNRLIYESLFPRLKTIGSFIFDKSLRMRRLFLQMLVKLQNIKSFDMKDFVCLDDFLTMMIYDHNNNPANSINKLYVKFLYPIFWKEKDNAKMVTRVHNFIVKDADACNVFVAESMHSAGVDSSLKLARLLLLSLFLCYEGSLPSNNSKNKPVLSIDTPKRKGRGRKRSVVEITDVEAENTTDERADSFESDVIPASDVVFQKKLFHLLSVMVNTLQLMCSENERTEGSMYLLSDMTHDRLLSLHIHATESGAEDDFLSFLSFFSFSQINNISNRFISVILSSSQQYLESHLQLFVQLVYQWDIGMRILDASLQQIQRFLTDPDAMCGDDDSTMNVTMPLKKSKTEKTNKKGKKTQEMADVSLSLSLSLCVLDAVINDCIEQSNTYSPDVLSQIYSILSTVLSSLRSYIASDDLSLSHRPQAALHTYYSLISILFKIETYHAVTASLTGDIQTVTSTPPELQNEEKNSLLGAIPPSMKQLRELLSTQLFTLNETGNFLASLLHLLIIFTHKCVTLLLFDEDFIEAVFLLARAFLNNIYTSDPEAVKNSLSRAVCVSGVTYEEEENSSIGPIRVYMDQRVLPALGKLLQVLRTIAVSVPDIDDRLLPRLIRNIFSLFPLETISSLQSALTPILKSNPFLLQEVVDGQLSNLHCSLTGGREDGIPSVMSLQTVQTMRADATKENVLLSQFSKNNGMLTVMCYYLCSKLTRTTGLDDTICVLATLLFCIESRTLSGMRVPSACIQPLKAYATDLREKYKENLTTDETSESRESIEFVMQAITDVIQKGEGVVAVAKPKRASRKRQQPEKLEVIDSEEESVEGSAVKDVEVEIMKTAEKEEKMEEELPLSAEDEEKIVQCEEVGEIEIPLNQEADEKLMASQKQPPSVEESQSDISTISKRFSDSFFDEPEY